MIEVKSNLERPLVASPQSGLENMFIAEYLLEKGYHLPDLRHLPEHIAKGMMKDACIYASLKLTEIESRARFCREIEG